jgi:hypothetical protein
VGIPEREFLATVRRAEGFVDVDDLLFAGLHGRAELIDQGAAETRGLDLAQRVLETAVGRLRRERRAALGTAADGKLHQRVVPELVIAVLVAAGDRRRACHHQLDASSGLVKRGRGSHASPTGQSLTSSRNRCTAEFSRERQQLIVPLSLV